MTLAARWMGRLPWLSLAAFTALWVARWPTFPLVLDPYYHLLIGTQVADASGPLAFEWWEYAPIGRPHLYPPVLHILLALLLKLGCPPIVALRVLSAALLPALLLTIFLVMRRRHTPAIALSCLWAGMIPFAFHLHSTITFAATLGLIELVWLVDAIDQDRPVAAGLLIALLCYTHLGLPAIALTALGCYAMLRPAIQRRLLSASWGLLLAAPWYLHLLRHREFLHAFPRQENAMLELMPILYAAALVGAWRCWWRKGRELGLLGCWAGFIWLAPHYPYRWLNGEGMIPVILLAGVGMAHAQPTRLQRAAIIAGWLLLLCSPTLARAQSGWRWQWFDGAPWHLIGAPWVTPKEIEAGFYSPHIERLAQSVRRESRPGEILWSNAPYAIGLVAALAHRPISSAMFNEVTPARAVDPIGAAHLIVWFKLDDMPGDVSWAQLTRYPLRRVADGELAVLLRHDGVVRLAHPPRAVMPLWLAAALLGAAVVAVVWELGGGQVLRVVRRRFPSRPEPTTAIVRRGEDG